MWARGSWPHPAGASHPGALPTEGQLSHPIGTAPPRRGIAPVWQQPEGSAFTPSARPHAAALAVAYQGGMSSPAGLLRIGLTRLSGRSAVSVKLGAAGVLADAATGERVRTLAPGESLRLAVDYNTGEVVVRGAGYSVRRQTVSLRGGVLQVEGRRYPDTLLCRVAGAGLQLVNQVDVERYLEGVLPGELPAWFGLEAQKALAVCARSYALVQRGKHGDFDLCDRPHCQMYVGLGPGGARALAAVQATRGLALWSGEELVYAFYSADCGGVSTGLEEVPLTDKPPGTKPYLRVVRDRNPAGKDYCAGSPYHYWRVSLTRQALQNRLNKDPETRIGQLQSVEVRRVDASGRVADVVLRGRVAQRDPSTGASSLIPVEKQTTGWALRRAVGSLRLKSTRMRIEAVGSAGYRFIGSGFGHGLGLCQIGADGRAKAGQSFQQILAVYYPNARVAPLSVASQP